MLACLDYLVRENNNPYGTYAGKLNTGRVGTSGHSQGGGGSIMAGQDTRVRTTAPIQPYTIGLGHDSASQRRQQGPMFLMSGGGDTIAIPYPVSYTHLDVYKRQGQGVGGQGVFRDVTAGAAVGDDQRLGVAMGLALVRQGLLLRPVDGGLHAVRLGWPGEAEGR